MRIAHFISKPIENEYSSVYIKSTIAYNLCLNFVKRGHQADIFTSSNDKKDHEIDYNGIKIHQYGSILGYRSESVSPGILYKPLEKDIDIAHVHSGISISVVAGYRYAIKRSKPLVITWHGDSLREYGRYSGIVGGSAAYFYKKYMANKILSNADIIISPSEYYIDKSKFLVKYRNKIITIPNGINFDTFKILLSKEECKTKVGFNGKSVVLFMGGLYPLKGPEVLLKAIVHVVKSRKNVIFIFAGSGNCEKYIKVSRKLGIEQYVKFVGYITSNKAYYYNSADIFVLPSYEEMFPIVLLEASASGLPLIVSNLVSLKCIVRNYYNGIFTKVGSDIDLAEAINYLLDNEDVRKKMGELSREEARAFSWDIIAQKTEKVYEELL